MSLSHYSDADSSSPLKMNVPLIRASSLLPLIFPLSPLCPFYFLQTLSISPITVTNIHTHKHTLTLYFHSAPLGSPPPPISEQISSKVSSQVTLTLTSLTAAKHRSLERTHCFEHTHTHAHTVEQQRRT